jgi:mono/diheme cytochrome c family protein
MRLAPFALLCALAPLLLAGCQTERPAATPTRDDVLAHGKYLVENVGMCGDCHTPMGPQGPDPARALMGAELPFSPAVPIPEWTTTAPAIAGLPSLSDEEAIAALTTGQMPGGGHLRPPMPAFRFHHDDAVAVVTYLRTLARN